MTRRLRLSAKPQAAFSFPHPRRYHPRAMSKLRLIQAGVGGMGKAWWTNATKSSPDFDLVAIVDISDAALNEAGDALAIAPDRRFKTLESALSAVDADAVLTVTPPPIHVEHAKLVFFRGLHLL